MRDVLLIRSDQTTQQFLIIITKFSMSASDGSSNLTGLDECFSSFQSSYCTRKLVQFITSMIFIIAAIIILSIFIYKHKVEKPLWIISIMMILILSLIANVLFCFYNQTYWLYALQNFLYNLYYLVLVSYICRAYVLKRRFDETRKYQIKHKFHVHHQQESIVNHKLIFYCIMGAFVAVYFSIFVVSLVFEVKNDTEQNESSSTFSYCEQIWYLIFDVFCVLLSIIVVIIMLKSQRQEYEKLVDYEKQEKKAESGNITSSENDYFGDSASQKSSNQKMTKPLLAKRINNPFQNLWIWVGLNIATQVFNLIQSGLLLNSLPPQCLIIGQNTSSSNIVQLVFLFLTMYLSYGATLWYVTLVKLIQQKTVIDRSIQNSEEVRVQGNIQLFIPSKEETITFT